MSKSPSMGCDGQEGTNGRVYPQGGGAWNLPETSPVTLVSLNSTMDEYEIINLQVESRTMREKTLIKSQKLTQPPCKHLYMDPSS